MKDFFVQVYVNKTEYNWSKIDVIKLNISAENDPSFYISENQERAFVYSHQLTSALTLLNLDTALSQRFRNPKINYFLHNGSPHNFNLKEHCEGLDCITFTNMTKNEEWRKCIESYEKYLKTIYIKKEASEIPSLKPSKLSQTTIIEDIYSIFNES